MSMRWKISVILLVIPFLFSISKSSAQELATSSSSSPSSSPPNVLLITIDTIRPDHIGCYGYKRIKTPHMDALARKGILFENTFSPVPLTLPSHASILTGTYTAFHGIRDNGTYALAEEATTLAELLKKRGYTTAAFISSYVLDRRFGLDQGFDVYNDDLSSGTEQHFFGRERRAEPVTQAAIAWLTERKTSPFFLWIHYFDPHMHYDPPPPFSEEYADNPYDGEIAYTDHWVGKLLETMQGLNLFENTLIVLTGDHGEGLGEHREKTHGIFIYDATLQVPLIFHSPRILPAPKRIPDLVRLIDIAPTILAIAGMAQHQEMQGVSLLPLAQGSVQNLDLDLYCESFYPRFTHNWSPLVGLRTAKWKYIDAPSRELYQVERDPGETRNLLDNEPEEAKRLHEALSQLKGRITSPLARQDAQRIPLDEGTRERLQSLGYVFAPSTMEKKGDYPDPKLMIAMLEHMDRGLEYSGKKEFGKARDEFVKILDDHPRDVDALTILGHTYEAMGEYEKSMDSFEKAVSFGCQDLRIFIKLGSLYMKDKRYKEAEACFQKALEINPRCKEAFIHLGIAHYQEDELDQALTQFQKALAMDPDEIIIHTHLAAIYQRQGRYDQSVSACRAALAIDPNNPSALLTLGSTLMYLNRHQEALDALQRALTLKPDSARGHYFAGLVFFQMKNMDRAIEHFKKAIELQPDWALPHFNLGYIYHQTKNLAGARKEYETALKLKPDLIQARQLLEELELETKGN